MTFGYRLTVVIPIRFSADRQDALERLKYPLYDILMPDEIEIMVIDDGSAGTMGRSIENVCVENGYRYCRIESEQDVFSIGRARNYGAQAALTKYIMFQDVDLMPYPGFYRDVLREIEVQGLQEYVERFLMFGVIYLSASATTEYCKAHPEIRKAKFIQYLLDDDQEKIEKFSTGTSVTVWRRYYYLACGGNDPDFEGWGYEDIEFTCRAIRRVKKFPLPAEFSLDYRNCRSILEYKGWKSVYRLFGDLTFAKGIILFHAWHPVDHNSFYVKKRNRNRVLFEAKLEKFRKEGQEPPPLPMPERGKSVMFRDNPWVYNRWTAPLLGKILIVDEDGFSPESFVEFVRERNVQRVVFHNPYANERMSSLYETVRRNDIEYLVCERGGLPDAVFFDTKGFNGESRGYDAESWSEDLADEERSSICDYIKAFKTDGRSLETQPVKKGAGNLRKQLGITPGVKILFVPLQRPTDAVIASFNNPIGGYDDFLLLMKRVAFCLPPDWVLVFKRHPLEKETPEIPSAIAADDFHINDLVELADALLVINSGVGLIGLLYGKTVLHAGLAFYGHEGISKQVKDHNDIVEALKYFVPDNEAILRFLHYLVFNYYSFASFKTRRVNWIDGSFMTSTTAIEYYILRFPGFEDIVFEQRDAVAVSENSILLDRYKNPNGFVRSGGDSALVKPLAAKNRGVPKSSLSPREYTAKEKRKMVKGRESQKNMDHAQNGKNLFGKKYRKFRNNPVMFFRDSKFVLLRKFGQLIGLF